MISEARIVKAGVSGLRVYIKNDVYIALRYLVSVDKINYAFCGNSVKRVAPAYRLGFVALC